MDAAGVGQALVIPGHGYERTRGIEDTRAENDAIARYRDSNPERFPGAIGIVEPRDGAASLDELKRAREELGLVGISFHTRFQGVSLDSRWILAYVAKSCIVTNFFHFGIRKRTWCQVEPEKEYVVRLFLG